MANHHWEVASRLVLAFKEELDSDARDSISEAQYNELAQMISDAIAEEVSGAADQVEELANRLRSLAQKREIGL